jgi:type IV fimbrial biogenesis protein FimT
MQNGFTLIEMLVTLALIAVLLRLAVPSFTQWIRNAQMRSVAEALQNGVRNAQSEAVRRNRQIVFALTNDEPGETAEVEADGRNWVIRFVRQAGLDADDVETFIEGGSFAETARDVAIEGPGAICFNSQGRLVTNATVGIGCAAAASSYDVTQAGADRSLRITLTVGGQVRMCDPARNIADSLDGCP